MTGRDCLPISQVRKVKSLKGMCGTFGCGIPSTPPGRSGDAWLLHVPAGPVRWCEEARAQSRWGAWRKEQQARVRLLGQVSPLLSAQASYLPLGLSVTTCEMGVVEVGPEKVELEVPWLPSR